MIAQNKTKKHKPIILGLTGSMAMGKSTVAKMFNSLGVPVFCADETAHNLLRDHEIVRKKIIKAFPSSRWAGRISRKRLGKIVIGNDQEMAILESIIHPFIRQEIKSFMATHKKENIIILDIPLLFEGGWERVCDKTICVTASKKTQETRALKRKNMTPEKLKAILARQMSDTIKRQKADIVLSSDKSKKEMRLDIKKIWENLHA